MNITMLFEEVLRESTRQERAEEAEFEDALRDGYDYVEDELGGVFDRGQVEEYYRNNWFAEGWKVDAVVDALENQYS
jgi:hypothetical protein